MKQTKPRFLSVVLDVDSTVSAIEGIDWLAARRGEEVAKLVADQTAQAMSGAMALEKVYGERLSAVSPSSVDIEELAQAYVDNIARGAKDAVREWQQRGVRVVLVSGGIRSALLPLARELGVDGADVHAVGLLHDPAGYYAGFDETSPLSVATGKRDIVVALSLPRPILAVGDGSTDLEMQSAVDAFAAFTGFVSRPAVVARADYVVQTFAEISLLLNA